MPIDETMLDAHRGLNAPVRRGRLCGGCGYTLDGLTVGSPCPECGKTIGPNKSTGSRDDSLTNAGVEYLHRLRPVALALGLGAFAYMIGLFVSVFFPVAGGLLCVGSACLWMWCVFVITQPKPHRPGLEEPPSSEMPRTRLIARLTQFGWLAAPGLILLSHAASGTVASVLSVTGQFSMLCALVGFIPLSVWLGELSDWGRDGSLGMRFRASAWLIALVGLLFVEEVAAIVGLGGALGGFLSVLAFWGSALALAGLALLLLCLLQFSVLVQNATSSAIHIEQREERLRLKKLQQEQRAGVSSPGEIRRPEGTKLPCRKCGYDLTGLPSDVPCPECGDKSRISALSSRPARIPPPPKIDQTPIPLGDEPEPETQPKRPPASRHGDVPRAGDIDPYELADD